MKSNLKTKVKKNQAITLIALVVTIVVLIILAGVSINLILGQNGLITKAKEAKENMELAQIEEQNKLNELTEYMENIENREPINNMPAFTKVANAPDISRFNASSTYYVSWDLSSTPYVIDDTILISAVPPSNWYDYTAGVNKWANIKTTGGGNNCYFVWIPRYAYKVPNRSTESTIEVKFLEGTSNNPIDGSSITITNNTTEGSWNVSPAFWWDKDNDGVEDSGEQLEGIWVAKYEASSSSVSTETIAIDLNTTGGGDNTNLKVRSIPNVTSWRGITVNNMFTVCRNLTTSGNSIEGASNIDSHMMKNTEWGAVAYLSRSIYGKNDKIWNNPWSYEDTTYFADVTGRANKNSDPDAFLDGNNTVNYETVTDAYNVGNGPNASTTGNVYGIYDMAGGAWEYVAGYLSDLTPNSSYSTLANADNKYKDKYKGNSATNTTNYSLNTNKYGDAIYETSTAGENYESWDNDHSWFLLSTSPIFMRGGPACDNKYTGIFAFNASNGNSIYITFRPCLVNL